MDQCDFGRSEKLLTIKFIRCRIRMIFQDGVFLGV